MIDEILTGGLASIVGTVLGGGFRLLQAGLESREKQRDRDQEFRMTQLHGQLAEQASEFKLRELGAQFEATQYQEDLRALVAGTQAQAQEAQSAGGAVAFLSGTVRPVVTYGLVVLYCYHKISQVALGAPVWVEADMALLSSVLSFWFLDRSLRRGRSNLSS